MFGGHGVYAGPYFFAIIADGRLFFKVSAESKKTYEVWGMETFRTGKSYYEVPSDILEDSEQLAEWAETAIQAARKAVEK